MAAMLVVNTINIFLWNLHEKDVSFPEERNAFVLDHLHGRRDVTCKLTWDDSQRRFFAQHSIAMFKQCCNQSKPCRNNVATLQYCPKNCRCYCNITFSLYVRFSQFRTRDIFPRDFAFCLFYTYMCMGRHLKETVL